MSPEVKEIAVKLLGLPTKSRAVLAERLISSLDDVEDNNVKRLWGVEVGRRYSEIQKKSVKLKQAGKVFLNARKKLA